MYDNSGLRRAVKSACVPPILKAIYCPQQIRALCSYNKSACFGLSLINARSTHYKAKAKESSTEG